MKTTTESITISINKSEALSVINALQLGIKGQITPDKGEEGAGNLLELLRGNFQSSKGGVHFVIGS